VAEKVRCTLFVVTLLNAQDCEKATASKQSEIMNKSSAISEMGDRL